MIVIRIITNACCWLMGHSGKGGAGWPSIKLNKPYVTWFERPVGKLGGSGRR